MRAAFVVLAAASILGVCAPTSSTAQTPASAPRTALTPPLRDAVQILSTTQLEAIADSIPSGPVTTFQIARFDGLANSISRRDTSGVHERHEAFTDIFVVQRGRARLRYGGTVEGERSTSAGEWKGGTIHNGSEQEIKPGDIVVIPAGIPHQLLLAPGESFVYFVFKVAKPVAR